MDNKRIGRKIGIMLIVSMSIISFLVGISTARAATNSTDNKQKVDVRFLVDMSSKMKEFDPNNIRIRTLQKIVKALPEDATSGIWTYGKYVNMLVPLGVATPQWKKQAIYKMDKIGGYGEYRNLTEAVSQALHGWQTNNGEKKYIVILTNGDLKVAQSKAKNAESQLQLLTKVLPKLKNAGIEIHTVSLSKDADNRLLKALASQTNGKWYSVSSVEFLTSVVNHAYSNINGNSKVSANDKANSIIKNTIDHTKLSDKSLAKHLMTGREHSVVKLATANKQMTVPKSTLSRDSKPAVDKMQKSPSKTLNATNKHEPNKIQKSTSKEERKEMDFNWPTVYSG